MNPVERREFLRRLGVLFGGVAATACGGSGSGEAGSVSTSDTPVGGGAAGTVGVGSTTPATTTAPGAVVPSPVSTSAPATGALVDAAPVNTGSAGTTSPSTPADSAASSPNSAVASPPPGPVSTESRPPTTSASSPVGAMQFSLVSPKANLLTPFTLGFAFRAGDVASGQTVVSADVPSLQVLAKNRWPDGSLKFAVVSGLAPLSANVQLTVRLTSTAATSAAPALGLAQLKATGITAAVSTDTFGSASWTNADWDAPFSSWISGPQMSSWLYRKPIGSDAHLVAWLEVRLYAGGAVEVLPWIENGYLLVPGPTSKAATFGFTLGGTSRFSAAIDLPNHCRTPLVSAAITSYWLSTDPQVTPKHDTDYLQSTALVPSYSAKVAPDAARVQGLVSSYTPLQQGNMPTGMGGAGYHGSIGLLPEWDVLYLTTTSARAYNGLIFNAYSAGRYGIHFRDEKTQRPLRFSSYPNLVIGGGSKINDNGASTTDSYTPTSTGTPPATWAFTHHPSVGFMAYLVTGRWYFMEELQFAATLHFLKTTDWRRNFTQGVMETQANTTRGIAWIIRTLAQVACITPDDDLPLRNEFLASLQANIDWNHALYVAQPNNPFGWAEPYSDYSGAGNNVYFEATWQQDFYTAVFGYAKALQPAVSAASRSKLDEFFAWKARSIVGRLGGTGPNDYPFYEAAPYTIAVAPTDKPDFLKGTGPWFANWGEIYKARTEVPNPPGTGDQLRGGFFPEATSYWGNMQPAIAYAVQHGVPGALQAYQRLTSASNWSRLANNFNINPVWSVRPGNLVAAGASPVPNSPAQDPATPAVVSPPSTGSGNGSGSTNYPAPQGALPTPPTPAKPSWADTIPANAWTTLPGTAFAPWAKTNIPAGAYYGTDPFNAIVNAFCDPANDPWLGAQYFFGGGHGDGSCNAVVKFDHKNLSWSLVGQPTPPSVYLPSYPNTKPYPSGRTFDGWFLPKSELPDPRDHVHAAPALARMSTHMYTAAVKRGTRLHYFYSLYAEFDTATGEWMGRGVDLGAQLVKFRPQYGNVALQQGTVAMYDEVTDRMFVTLTPGDAGGGWRNAIMVFNPNTRSIESVHESNASTFGLVNESLNMCRVGRDLFCFNKIGNYGQPSLMNQGFIFNMESKTFKRFVLTGDTQGSTFGFSNTQETIPSFYDGKAIRRWNYQASDRNKIYSVDPRPVSGSGSVSDPLVFVQTVRNIGGTVPGRPMFIYSRLMYHGGAGCALMISEATSDWVALRLS